MLENRQSLRLSALFRSLYLASKVNSNEFLDCGSSLKIGRGASDLRISISTCKVSFTTTVNRRAEFVPDSHLAK